MNRFLYLSIILFLFNATVSAQTPDLTIGSEKVCAGREVLVPVTGSNLVDIGAITLLIGFDTVNLSYISLENLNNQLPNPNYNYVKNPPSLVFAWSNMNPANFPQTKLFDLKFSLKNQITTPVVFLTGCEIANSSLQILPVSYINGGVIPANPFISAQPQDLEVKSGATAVFTVVTPNSSVFNWKTSPDQGVTWIQLQDEGSYSGTHTGQLKIQNVPISFNKYKYLCEIGDSGCNTRSAIATLTVDSMTPVDNPDMNDRIWLKNNPNPFNNVTNIEFVLPEDGNIQIKIYNSTGKGIVNLLDANMPAGNYHIQWDGTSFPAGMYLCLLKFSHTGKSLNIWKKIIKI